MRKAVALTAIVVTALVGVVTASTAGAAAPVKVVFKGSYSGTAVVKLNDNIADIKTDGTGSAPVIGAGKVTGAGTGDSSVQPCVPFTGTGTITGAAGTKLGFKVVAGSQGCGDEAGEIFSIVARATVTSATGKLAKAKGNLKITGTYDRNAGTFAVKFTGTLTK
jgi:hypothetical protein